MSILRLLCPVIFLALAALAGLSLSIPLLPKAQADLPYSLSAVPAFAQEGNTIDLFLAVNSATPSTLYTFQFSVRDPATITFQSPRQNYTTGPGENRFSILILFPSPSLPGSTSLPGQYTVSVDQLAPIMTLSVATTTFTISLADSGTYQRTQTVNIQGSGYRSGETVTVSIRTQTSSTLVFSRTVAATSQGIVASSWKILVNATIDTYVVTLTGTLTTKNPPDLSRFTVTWAVISIPTINSSKLSYQRTETMGFSFQATYPDGSTPTTGVGLVTLTGPTPGTITLTATYNSTTQTFLTSYRTSMNNQTGTWTAALAGHAYSDAYGNTGPGISRTNALQLIPATLTITVVINTNFAVGQQSKFNATITYPDGTTLQSGTVGAHLVYGATPSINNTVPVVFDTGLKAWVGTYTPQTSDKGGLWSLTITASDMSTPANSGSATRAITLQNSTGNASSFPLYYFGIIAALIAALLIAVLMVFKRRKVTHARLKIDLEAVRSEAGRIESQDFFQSVRGQVRKDKDGDNPPAQ